MTGGVLLARTDSCSYKPAFVSHLANSSRNWQNVYNDTGRQSVIPSPYPQLAYSGCITPSGVNNLHINVPNISNNNNQNSVAITSDSNSVDISSMRYDNSMNESNVEVITKNSNNTTIKSRCNCNDKNHYPLLG